ncbi:MAG: HAMP domain-containing histidine kinase [Bacteroidales bacterium]|nr:HAMP domain-containing histidine kinase [Bacteroidales bacterium]MBN2757353.1 HAMP domain-containing histidine kinase [Bacteroidales bacterium]
MKNHTVNLKYLIIPLILIIIAVIIEKAKLKPANYQVNIEKFSNVLSQKEIKLNSVLTDVKNQITPFLDSNSTNLFEVISNSNQKFLDDEGFIVCLYINDSLRYWTDNSIFINDYYSKSKLNNNVIKLNNAWYFAKKIHQNNLEIIGLFLIKHKYSYKNEYLSDNFHKDYNLPSSIQISVIPLSYSYDIYDKDNNYLLSLVPTNSIISENTSWGIVGLLYFISFSIILLILNKWIRQISISQNHPGRWIIFITAFLIFIRYLMIEFKYPIQIYSLDFFDPGYFAYSWLFPSLGDFFINSLLILFFTNIFFIFFRSGKLIRFLKKKKTVIRLIVSFLNLLFIFIFFYYIIYLINILVYNSSLPLDAYKVLELNLFSLITYIILALLIASLIYLIEKLIFVTKNLIKLKHLLILVIISFSIFTFSYYLIFNNIEYISLIFLFSIISLIIYFHYFYKKPNFSFFIVIIFFSSVYITMFLNQTLTEKEENKAKLLVTRLLNERDRIAEHLLVTTEEKIKADETLNAYISQTKNQQLETIHAYLDKQYFQQYFEKYDLDIVVCCDCEGIEPANSLTNCADYYGNLIDEFGEKIKNSNFYYIDNHDGRLSYLGSINYYDTENLNNYTLYIKLDSKLITSEIGYPDLLIDGKIKKRNTLSSYSYAKYSNHELVTRSGNFPYDLNDKMFQISEDEYKIILIDDYKHLIYKPDNQNLIVLSKLRIKSIDLIVAFSYVFVFLIILILLVIAINNFKSLIYQIQLNFENKLLMAMIFILAISFILVGAGTVYYNIRQFELKHNKNISEKIETVLKGLELEAEKPDSTSTEIFSGNELLISELLAKFSEVYFTDINIYKSNGRLLATSRPELFHKELIGQTMNPEAYRQMKINEKIRFIHKEKIGNLEYSSAYALFKSHNFKEKLYLNLPYFTRPAELRKEISNLIVAVINLYVVLFIIISLVSFFMANKITQPLRMLQNKFKKIELGKQSEQIIYNKKDEIGALVSEYNRMVLKLDESIQLLAKNERESAWREMAKQIAHEIKNPLTPMKLSVQFLQRSWEDKDVNFEKKLEKSAQTLIEQINTLSSIASEFSNFAKMPKPNKEIVNIVEKIENTIVLFSNTENISITSNIDDFQELIIIADNKQVSRAFINLTKNAIQAIPSEKEGKININISKSEKLITIKIKDNGTGINNDQKEKLFIPSFTTKTSGMGMGLPIVKNIIESAEGKIWFETEIHIGTTFFIEFPIATDEQIAELKN